MLRLCDSRGIGLLGVSNCTPLTPMSNPAHHGATPHNEGRNSQEGATEPSTIIKPSNARFLALLRGSNSISLEPRYYAFNCRPRQVRALVVEDSTEAALVRGDLRGIGSLALRIQRKVELLEARQAANLKRQKELRERSERDRSWELTRDERNSLIVAHCRRDEGVRVLRDCLSRLHAVLRETEGRKG